MDRSAFSSRMGRTLPILIVAGLLLAVVGLIRILLVWLIQGRGASRLLVIPICRGTLSLRRQALMGRMDIQSQAQSPTVGRLELIKILAHGLLLIG